MQVQRQERPRGLWRKVTLRLVLRVSAGFQCVERGGKGLPSKGLRGMEKRQKPLKEAAMRSGTLGDAVRTEPPWEQSFRVPYVSKWSQPQQTLESLPCGDQGPQESLQKKQWPSEG